MTRTVAALYVERGGCYYGLPDVDPWDVERDARLYAGPYPVVAHPPCARWCQIAGLVEHRYGYRRGEDAGAFEAALSAVRRWGGVLEHPAYSKAWPTFGLPSPPRQGGWVSTLFEEGWSAHVEQVFYGHRARKATWLYAVNTRLPVLRWGRGRGEAVVSDLWNRSKPRNDDDRPRLRRGPAKATPLAFRDTLIAMARSVYERAA